MKAKDEKKNLRLDRRESYFAQQIVPQSKATENFHLSSVELIFNLALTNDVLLLQLARNFLPYSLSPSAFNLLAILARSNNAGMTLSELSELLIVSRANITGVVDSLVARGLVRRVDVAQDRRKRLAQITAAGKALIAQILPPHYAAIKNICAGLNEKERKLLSQLLTKLRQTQTAQSATTPRRGVQK